MRVSLGVNALIVPGARSGDAFTGGVKKPPQVTARRESRWPARGRGAVRACAHSPEKTRSGEGLAG